MLNQQDPEGREHLHQAYFYIIKVKCSLNLYISSVFPSPDPPSLDPRVSILRLTICFSIHRLTISRVSILRVSIPESQSFESPPTKSRWFQSRHCSGNVPITRLVIVQSIRWTRYIIISYNDKLTMTSCIKKTMTSFTIHHHASRRIGSVVT